MASSTGIHCPDIAFIPRGFVSRKLFLFLMKQGLGNGVAARAINKSDQFIDNLVSRHHSVHISPYAIAQELKALQNSEALPCSDDGESSLVGYIEDVPQLPYTEREMEPVPETPKCGRRDAKIKKAVSRVSEPGPSGSLPPHILYLLEIGFNLEHIKVITRKDPHFAYYSLEGKVRPLIEFLLNLGLSNSDLPNIFHKCPQLCGLSLSENLIPKMAFAETLGVDKTKWASVMTRYPTFLCVSRPKVKATVEFLYEMGVEKELIGKLLTRHPSIVGLNIEDQLRPKAEYFQSLGGDVAILLRRCPQVMGLSMEAKLKPVTKFFMQNGFSKEEIGILVLNYPHLYALSLKDNLVPKWEFFLTMDYSKQDLFKHLNYFTYSFEDRIKPRYKLMKESGVKLSLSQLLVRNDDDFEKCLKRKIQKLNKGRSRS